MRFFVKAIATGFAMSLGSALFKKASKKLGLDNEEANTESDEPSPEVVADGDAPDPA